MRPPERSEALRAAAAGGTPCFVYFLDEVAERIDALKHSFGGRVAPSYAVKSNPHPALLRFLRGRIEYLDVSSGGEIQRAVASGWPPEALGFTGPGKRAAELQSAVDTGLGEVVLESVEEAEVLSRLAVDAGQTRRVLVRLSPRDLPRGFGVRMAGRPTPFGIDEEVLDEALPRIVALPRLALVGFHVYSGTQCLDAAAIAENFRIHARLFRRCAPFAERLDKLVFGSGIGIPYHEGDAAVDLAALAREANPVFDELRADERFAEARFLLELGRYLVGEAGHYVTRVLRVKRSRGAEVVVCDGGMNHHLGACGHLGSVIHRNYPIRRVPEGAEEGGADSAPRPYEIVGPLCTSIDTLGHAALLPPLEPGDLIAVGCSGAYGPTASPTGFISHPPPREVAVEGGRLVDLSDESPVRAPAVGARS